jgi:PKD repeat protein
MKKLITLAAFILLMMPAMGQLWVTVTGFVTDSATGNPIPNYPVTIFSDSTGGFVYNNTVYTTSTGFYADSMMTTSNFGLLYIHVWDCVQNLHEDTCNIAPWNTFFIKNFSICYNNVPGCDAAFTYNVTQPLTVSFTDQSVNAAGIWYWNFDDGGSSTAQNPVHTYAVPGIYNVELVIGDSAVCMDYVTHTVVLTDTTGGGGCQAYYTFIPDSLDPLMIRFFDASQGNIISWSWNFGDPASGTNNTSSQQNAVHYYTTPGVYTVCLSIQGADSTCYDTYCENIIVGNNTGCQAQFTWYPDSIPAQGYAVQFIDLSSGTPTSWMWDFGDGTPPSSVQNPLHIYPQINLSYNVCLTIQCQGVTSTWCATVAPGNPVNCTSYFTYSGAGLDMSYEGFMLYGQPATYSWNFGDGQSGTGQNATHQYAAAGIYYVSLTTTTTDTMACTYTTSQSVMVGDSGQLHQVYGQVFAGSFPLTIGMVMIIGVDTGLNYVPYIDVTMVDSIGVYYFTTVPDGDYMILAIPFDSAGYLPTYYGDALYWEDATLVSLGNPSNPYDIHLIPAGILAPGPGNINGQINNGDFFSGMLDKITMFILDGNQNVLSYDLVDAGGSFTFPQIGYGSYLLHPELAGCTSDLIPVEITEQNPDVNVVLTYSGGKILGISENHANLAAGAVYPNPVRSEANINITTEKSSTLTAILYDLTGREVTRISKQVPAGDNRLTIPVSSLNSGVYMLRVTSDEGVSAAKKLVISR